MFVLFSIIDWLAETARTLFPWPFVVLVLFFWITQSSSGSKLATYFFRRFKTVKISGVEISLSEDARREIQEDAQLIFDSIVAYQVKIDREVTRFVDLHDMSSKLERAVEDVIQNALEETKGDRKLPKDFRCTVHVPDPIFEGYLYQLLHYYPVGDGANRRFSDRYGIIGKVWRSGLPHVVGRLLKDKDTPSVTEEDISRIALEWGMTKSEARRAAKKVSYASAVIMYEQTRVGVFFMDSTEFSAFSDKDDDLRIIEAMKNAAVNSGLAQTMNQFQRALEKVSPRLRLVP